MEQYASEKIEMIQLITEIMKYFNHYNDDGWKAFFEAMLKRCHLGYPIKENDPLYALKGHLFKLCNHVYM